MRIKQNTYGLDKNFLIAIAKVAKVQTNNLVVKIQRSSSSSDLKSKYGNSSGICFRRYNGKPFIGMRLTKDTSLEQIGHLWLHELSHHRDNLKHSRWIKRHPGEISHKHWGGEKKADKFADTIWNKYILTTKKQECKCPVGYHDMFVNCRGY